MRITSINNYCSYNFSPNFGVNLNSPKLKFSNKDFYVRIKGYGRDSSWAKIIKETADKAVTLMREKCDFENALRIITTGVVEANQIPLDLTRRKHSGILRIARNGWRHGSDWGSSIITYYNRSGKGKYTSYADRFDYVERHPLTNPYRDISLTRPVHDIDFGKFLEHGNARAINNAFTRLNNIYAKLYSDYILKDAKSADMPEINNSIAEMRWILAHATPWERGSDAISNTLMRSIYKAMGIKTYPLKKGISLDLEAYCTELKDYQQKFASYFDKPPMIVE